MSANSHQQPVCVQPPALHSELSFFVLFCFLAEGEEDDDFGDEIISRTHLKDSWLWMDKKLPDCPTGQPDW